GEHGPGAEVDVGAEDRVADVVQVRRLGLGQEDRALDLGGGPDTAVVADPAAAAHVGAGADLDVLTDPQRPFEHHPRRDARALADHDAVTEEVYVRTEHRLY